MGMTLICLNFEFQSQHQVTSTKITKHLLIGCSALTWVEMIRRLQVMYGYNAVLLYVSVQCSKFLHQYLDINPNWEWSNPEFCCIVQSLVFAPQWKYTTPKMLSKACLNETSVCEEQQEKERGMVCSFMCIRLYVVTLDSIYGLRPVSRELLRIF